MKIIVTREKFHTEWESTGKMKKESPRVFIQTYSHKRFGDGFVQKRINTPFGTMIEMSN